MVVDNLESILNKEPLKNIKKKVSKSMKILGCGVLGFLLGYGALNTIQYNDVLNNQPKVFVDNDYSDVKIEKFSDANKTLYNFENEIYGAREVKKYITHDAKHVLVHIRQVHDIPESSHFQKFETEKVQDSIYKILENLYEKNELREIYQEGLTEENFEYYTSLIKNIKNTKTNKTEIINIFQKEKENLEKLVDLYNKDPNSPYFDNYFDKTKSDYISLENQLEKYIDYIKNEIQFLEHRIEKSSELDVVSLYDAVVRISSEKDIDVLALEDFELHSRAIKHVYEDKNMIRDEYFERIILDEREDEVLKRITKNENGISYVVFGGEHDFIDNIHKWNRKNPNEKISLIEITPDFYF